MFQSCTLRTPNATLPGPSAGLAATGAMGDDDEEDEDFAASEEGSDEGSDSDSEGSGAEMVEEKVRDQPMAIGPLPAPSAPCRLLAQHQAVLK
jgi:hypothetical protein